MSAIYGLYDTPDDAQHAVDRLKSAGYPLKDLTIISSEPLEEYEFGQRDRKTSMPKLAVAGGAVGCLTAYLLTSITQQSWAINTGGMPIVTNFTNLIIIFEMTMMGAIFTTVGTLLVSAKIPGRRGAIYDREVSEGKILIGVTNPRDEAAVQRALGENTRSIS